MRELVGRGPSSSTPVLSSQQSGGEEVEAAGVEYGLSGGSARATLVMSEWVKTDGNGWSKVSGRLGKLRLDIWASVRTFLAVDVGVGASFDVRCERLVMLCRGGYSRAVFLQAPAETFHLPAGCFR